MKRSTIYIDSDLHKVLKIKSVETSISMSELISKAVKLMLDEDYKDLKDYKERKDEEIIPFEKFLEDLKTNGKI